MRRAIATIAAAIALALVAVPVASAYWTSSGTGTGSATTATMPDGLAPSTSAAGRTVTVTIDQVAFLGVDLGTISGGGYEVRRYPAGGGAAVTPGGTCGSLVTGAGSTVTCDETSTPPGFWRYAVTPILNSWTGAESSVSASQTVAPDAPATAASSLLPAADIRVTWANVPEATGYNIYRRLNSGSYNFAAPLNGGTPVTGTTYDDTTPVSGTAYNYVVRAVFVDGTQIESTNSPETTTLTADGTLPTGVTVSNPGTPLFGTVNFTATATDTISGVASVEIQSKPSAGSTWTTVCTDTAAPWACSFNSSTIPDGLTDFRALATDGAGNSTASAPVTNRMVDNLPPTTTLAAIANPIRATIAMTATATDAGTGVANVQFQRSPAGAGTWTTICTDAAAPYTCSFNTTTVGDGLYDFRAVGTDILGNAGPSTVQSSIEIDNTRPTAANIQTVNAGVLGRPETGDQVVYTFSEAMQTATILAGFTGASINVTVRINNVGGNDRLRVYNAANTTESTLGEVRLGGNYVSGNRTFTNSTMTMSGGVLTVTLGTPSGTVNTVAGNATLSWRPVTTPLDLAGNQMMNTARNEIGPADPNF